jgi:hypothetical protein
MMPPPRLQPGCGPTSLHLFEPRRIGQHFGRERLPHGPVRDVDEARVPDTVGADDHGFHDPFRSRATVVARPNVTVTLSWFDRALCHRCSLHRPSQRSEARYAT